jgi:hypothetical protein
MSLPAVISFAWSGVLTVAVLLISVGVVAIARHRKRS